VSTDIDRIGRSRPEPATLSAIPGGMNTPTSRDAGDRHARRGRPTGGKVAVEVGVDLLTSIPRLHGTRACGGSAKDGDVHRERAKVTARTVEASHKSLNLPAREQCESTKTVAGSTLPAGLSVRKKGHSRGDSMVLVAHVDARWRTSPCPSNSSSPSTLALGSKFQSWLKTEIEKVSCRWRATSSSSSWD